MEYELFWSRSLLIALKVHGEKFVLGFSGGCEATRQGTTGGRGRIVRPRFILTSSDKTKRCGVNAAPPQAGEAIRPCEQVAPGEYWATLAGT